MFKIGEIMKNYILVVIVCVVLVVCKGEVKNEVDVEVVKVDMEVSL